ncbi:MAG: pyridoxal-phosphate dependent enzyme [Proteobacteria bacterium]|nr:pyridoxal-phosphate dependent enzyme [Pseudomonadota bacterium]
MITLDDVKAARERIAPFVKRTPIERNQSISDLIGTNVYLKMELFQKTGSFKPRGAFNKMLRMNTHLRNNGVIAISGGNFAQGVAYAGNVLGVRSRILMPEYTPKNYLDATKSYGAEVELLPDIAACFAKAERYRQKGWEYFHPYDDPHVMEGYGTVGLELLEDLPDLTDVIVSIGGGGLMTGIAIAVKGLKHQLRVWTVETEGSETMGEALKAGKVVQIEPKSLAKTLGAPYVAEDALEAEREMVADHTIVSDKEAIEAQRFILERAKILTELAASCTLAAARKLMKQFSENSHVALVICGGNVSLDRLCEYKKMMEAT